MVQVNWRSVRIRTDEDSLATVPNSVIAKAQLINQCVPSRRRAASVEVTVPSSESSQTVMELIRRAILLCPGVLEDPAPLITLRRSGLRTCTYAVGIFVADTLEIDGTKSDLLREIRRHFQHAGIGREGPMSIADLLGSLVLFKTLSNEDVEALVDQATRHKTEVGKVLFDQDAASLSIFVVEGGVMEMTRRRPDRTIETLGRLAPGDAVGELGLINEAPRAFTLTSLTRCSVVEVPGAALKALLRSNPALYAAMERSARGGMALLNHDEVAQSTEPDSRAPNLLGRLRSYLQA